MSAYIATGPAGSKFANVRLRIHAQKIRTHPNPDELKTTIQVMDGSDPIAEDPITEAYLTPLELLDYLSQSSREGWDIEAA